MNFTLFSVAPAVVRNGVVTQRVIDDDGSIRGRDVRVLRSSSSCSQY